LRVRQTGVCFQGPFQASAARRNAGALKLESVKYSVLNFPAQHRLSGPSGTDDKAKPPLLLPVVSHLLIPTSAYSGKGRFETGHRRALPTAIGNAFMAGAGPYADDGKPCLIVHYRAFGLFACYRM